MKKGLNILIVLVGIFILGACGSSSKADYTTQEAEKVLVDGGSIDGKTVSITVDKLAPQSAFGYNIQTGEHMNFVSSENPKVETGDKLIVKVNKVESVMGSWIITYDKQ